MNPTTNAALVTIALFVGMLATLEIGRRIGQRRVRFDAGGAHEGLGAVEGALFALLGLLLAFAFSGAMGRFESRQRLVIDEANCIGTAYLRLDVLPQQHREILRPMLRDYLDARLAVYAAFPDVAAVETRLARANGLQTGIWNIAVAACRDAGSQPAHMLVLPALNEMFDIATTRSHVARIHPPTVVYAMIGIASLAAALLAGYGMSKSARRSWVHIALFVALIALTNYVVMDIEYPRMGLFRIDAADRVLVELRESMK